MAETRNDGKDFGMPVESIRVAFRHFFLRKAEVEYALAQHCDRAGNPLKTEIVALGDENSGAFSVPAMGRSLVKSGAASFFLIHNHPSSKMPEPSPQDKELTSFLEKMGETLGIELLDHLIVSRGGVYSFAAEASVSFADLKGAIGKEELKEITGNFDNPDLDHGVRGKTHRFPISETILCPRKTVDRFISLETNGESSLILQFLNLKNYDMGAWILPSGTYPSTQSELEELGRMVLMHGAHSVVVVNIRPEKRSLREESERASAIDAICVCLNRLGIGVADVIVIENGSWYSKRANKEFAGAPAKVASSAKKKKGGKKKKDSKARKEGEGK
jgi:DNA repair protein RadC